MSVELSKEDLFKELIDVIDVMNTKDFGIDPYTSPSRKFKQRRGDSAVTFLLKKFKKTTLYEFDKNQMQLAIDALHATTIGGM